MKKIGIFGGTMDPFTEAHEAIVKKVLDEKLVDEVVIIPTVVDYYRNPDDKWLTDDERIKVIRNLVCEMRTSGYNVSGWYDEIERHRGVAQEAFRKGRRYYNTIVDYIYWKKGWICDEELHREGDNEVIGKDYELYTIIGLDQYKNFKSWFMWDEILKLSKLIVVNGRNGEVLGETVKFDDDVPCQVVSIDNKYTNTSATEIRREYKGTIDAVHQYIKHLPPLHEKILQHTTIFDLVEKKEVQAGFRPVGINAPDWVTVVVRFGEEYLMVKQMRYGTMKQYTEFVCGQVEAGEAPRDAAIRELAEETGLKSYRAIRDLGSFATNPAFMNNRMHFFYVEVDAQDVEKMTSQKLDDHEKIEVCWVNKQDLLASFEVEPDGPALRALAVALAANHENGRQTFDLV